MKKVLRNAMFFAAIAGSISLTSCKDNKENEEVAPPMQNEMHQDTMTEENEEVTESSPEFTEEATAEVYNAYVEVKDALVDTDASEAQNAAENLVSRLEENSEESELLEPARKIAETEDVNLQREAFSELTAAMQPVLEGALASGEIYKQYCPMAFEGQGDYWYSSSKEIRNPYFGDKMLNCGRVDQTLN
ncbi:DUF3347 domain-containing protein [Salegentibacter sp. F188]|uniref:DUF3347 domain-containing protein n=1 Tax=Autumnicola patrickiae TaxID=3075591 RepID=A0ABU3E0B3_9FLAO|nr:DUF3347 domain-containing protein [Salegentibacter sp. F188]MDT0689416.1 DUF3347 domain-containing protein [Salegentibacter sp. F188]